MVCGHASSPFRKSQLFVLAIGWLKIFVVGVFFLSLQMAKKNPKLTLLRSLDGMFKPSACLQYLSDLKLVALQSRVLVSKQIQLHHLFSSKCSHFHQVQPWTWTTPICQQLQVLLPKYPKCIFPIFPTLLSFPETLIKLLRISGFFPSVDTPFLARFSKFQLCSHRRSPLPPFCKFKT